MNNLEKLNKITSNQKSTWADEAAYRNENETCSTQTDFIFIEDVISEYHARLSDFLNEFESAMFTSYESTFKDDKHVVRLCNEVPGDWPTRIFTGLIGVHQG
jgi:hypothetical protein